MLLGECVVEDLSMTKVLKLPQLYMIYYGDSVVHISKH